MSTHPIIVELVERRSLLGLTQIEMARRTGMSQSMISEMETGVNPNPTLKTIIKYAQAVNMLFEVKDVPC